MAIATTPITLDEFAQRYLDGRPFHLVQHHAHHRPDFIHHRAMMDKAKCECLVRCYADWMSLYQSYRRDGIKIVSRKLQADLWLLRPVTTESEVSWKIAYTELRREMRTNRVRVAV